MTWKIESICPREPLEYHFPLCNETMNGGVFDIFVSKFSNDLSILTSSTFIGGGKYDQCPSIAVDACGDVHVAGYTHSTDFPVTPGAYDESFNGGNTEAFVLRLSGDLNTLIASTFLNGNVNGYSVCTGIVLDGGDSLFVTGVTDLSDLPVTPGAYDETFNGEEDGFVAKLKRDLTELQAATYLGGSDQDKGQAIHLDIQGHIVVLGQAKSEDYPVTLDAFDDANNGGGYDLVLSKLDDRLSRDFLRTDITEVSAVTGGVVDFDLHAGQENAGRPYVLLGSMTGWSPGMVLPGGLTVLPLNWDGFTDAVYLLLNSAYFMDFSGILDGQGLGNARLDTQGPLPPDCMGYEICFSFLIPYFPWDFVSNPVKVSIVP
ncbi:MAG: SBBP repeat-containing protein [Planctomycetes bacterium]|nr:SBBP repeat-containing protein [Planctomycetota bacterium]